MAAGQAFGAAAKLKTRGGDVTIYRLRKLIDDGIGHIEKLPYSIRVLLEACLRHVDGFIVNEDDCVANTRKGKQVLNIKVPAEAIVCRPVAPNADHVATVGENRKLLIFKLAEVPEMARGKGVRCLLTGRIMSARHATKTDTTAVEAFRAGAQARLGKIAGGVARFFNAPTRLHTLDTEVSLA